MYSTGTMWEHNSLRSSLPIPAMRSACENQERLLPWLQQSLQPCFFHFFSSVSRATEFRGLKGEQKHISSDPVPAEFTLRFTSELLPIFTNSIVPFVSINYIWVVVVLLLPLVCLVFRMEEISSQTLITAPALICLSFVSKMFEELSH